MWIRDSGKFAHFVGDDGKSPTLFAGARCLDGRVQGQQIGLFGNLLDHTGDAADIP